MKTITATYTIIGILAILGGGVLLFIGLPVWQDIAITRTQIASEKERKLELEERRTKLQTLVAEKDLNHTFTEVLKKRIAEKDTADDIVLFMEDTSHALSLKANVLSISESTKNKDRNKLGVLPAGVNELSFSLDAFGDFTNILRFLQQSELGDRFFDIRLVTIGATTDGVAAHIDGRAFWKPKITIEETNAIFTVDEAVRNTRINPAALPEISIPTSPELGRANPFAPIS